MTVTNEQLGIVTATFTAAITALVDALDAKGALTKAEAVEALNERAVRMLVDQGFPEQHLFLLKALAAGISTGKRQ